jgi:DNA invertase Pin-like site-specific DNA recombinase
MEPSNKITAQHLSKSAYLYIRQSTIRQVFENTESTKRQYALRQRAIALGWHDEQIQVIDCDLGESGASTSRDGFRSLVSDVSLGKAGIVMGLEVSRLARNSSDWHRLLEICAFSSTLILDEEGIYNPSNFNDRLLLGLKGTMSEAELHMIRSRLFGGMLNKARRGELRMRPPIGYVYDHNDKIIKDPDKRVQTSINLLFETYRRIGTVGGSVKEFERKNIPFPKKMFYGPHKGETIFSPLTPSRAFQILKNPRYAGAYAYGIRQQTSRGIDAQPYVRFVEQEQWKAFIKDAHDSYISWEERLEILKKLEENASSDDSRKCTPREGPALLQGIAICGLCGRYMSVRYHTRRGALASPDYVCKHSVNNKHCQSLPGFSVDKIISEILLKRMSPVSIEVALSVQAELTAKYEEANRIRYLHVENARYEMESAKKRYMAIDPNNRLVADELEADWNSKIRNYREIQEEYERRRTEDQNRITEEQRRRILELTSDFPKLWQSTTTEDRDRKRMIRLLISDVTLTKEASDIKIQIRFIGGATEVQSIVRPRSACEEMRHSPEVTQEIDRLLDQYTDGEVASILNKNGLVSGTGKEFDGHRVQQIRRAYGIPSRLTRLQREGRFTIRQLCDKYGLYRDRVYDLRKAGKLKAFPYDDAGRYLYEITDESIFKTNFRTKCKEA